ncbi:MAG: tRNA pseudouridine(38-40) synthase TruA [Minwuia sp.]|nr:tRNA pseudouridine(38-40) synthase TruA [Minwuia sp.]
MPRYRLTLEFDGGGFVGWQFQPNGLSVQEVVETAIERLCGQPQPRIMSAGRTDAGVHALGMVAHADIGRDMTDARLMGALNFHLRPHPVVVRDVARVTDDFDARRSCLQRHYIYRIVNRVPPPALDLGRVWHVATPLDLPAMQTAAALLQGHHDFESFRSAHCQSKVSEKTLERLTVTQAAGDEVHIHASARSFLHNQVRILTGTLVDVGKGRWTPDDVVRALAARDRQAAGPTAPAGGLYFLSADYPQDA